MKPRTRLFVATAVSFVALGTGSAIYLLFRSKGILVFRGIEYVNWSSNLDSCRGFFQDFPLGRSDFAVYNLPCGLWSLSATNLFVAIHGPKRIARPSVVAWISSIPIVGVASELAQYYQLIPGTFDLLDVFAYVVGGVVGAAIGVMLLRK